jgi:predicted Zn-dependent peptidase
MGFPKKERLQKPHYPAVKPRPGAQSKYYEDFAARPPTPPRMRYVDLDGDVDEALVRPGVVVHRNENPANDVYTLQLRFGVGSEKIRALQVAAAYLPTIGTQAHAPDALKRALFLLNTTMDFEVTPERFVVELQGPEDRLEDALALVEEVMHQPVGDKKRLRQLRREVWGLDRVQRRDPGHMARAAAELALYGEHSSFLHAYGPKGMRKLDPGDVLGAWTQAQGYAVEVRYVGRRSADDVATAVGQTLTFADDLQPAMEHVVRTRVLPPRPTVYFLPRRNSIQTHLYFAIDGQPVPPEQRAAADAYTEYMGGGMAGLVFQEIREFRALAYSARARFVRDFSPVQAGYLLGYIGCQADKTFESIDVMRSLVQDMPRKPDRLPALESALARSQEAMTPDFRELQDRIEYWRWMGYDEDPRQALLPAYEALTFEDIDRFVERQIAGRPMTLVVVGDPKRFPAKRLAEYGDVIKLRPKDVLPR